jgi:hypothetical protein
VSDQAIVSNLSSDAIRPDDVGRVVTATITLICVLIVYGGHR